MMLFSFLGMTFEMSCSCSYGVSYVCVEADLERKFNNSKTAVASNSSRTNRAQRHNKSELLSMIS